MAVPCGETVSTPGTGPGRRDALAVSVPLVFERRSCGGGAKGERYFDQALTKAARPSGAGETRKG
ncbi:hypothetical protein ACG5V6_11810 [Streptomyces chitinivorans]|uniref:Uncharacterized protein n=1 Tax=Streptomyces chitinivorans TaxID=1257027 RepID=A0ABW7HSQ9_9ACTN|nr:hypothetical protein [Streptomyces chitinivorans]MDH2411028.1 hypothetical protein [Streptomyces chitinivorans]